MRELNWRLLVLGVLVCTFTAAASPYLTLKLGLSVDLTMGGMFLAAFVLEKRTTGKKLAVELNIIQTMISAVSLIAFTVVMLAAFHYIKTVFKRDVGFNPTSLQMFAWLMISANLGVFMSLLPRRSILRDKTLPWPSSKAILSIAETLADSRASATTKVRRDILVASTTGAAFLTFLRDGLGVIPPIVGNAALNMSMSLELAAIGLGMFVPLSVGVSQLFGTWIVRSFGELAAKNAALSGVPSRNIEQCMATLNKFYDLIGSDRTAALDFLNANCGKGAEFVQASSHFKYLVQWMMWPATAMVIAAALTSVLIPLVSNFKEYFGTNKKVKEEDFVSLADEEVPVWWIVAGIAVTSVLLIACTTIWFDMPWTEVVLAIAIQPVLMFAGLRVLGIMGSGPVSLMANATQFLFGLIWPAHIRSNLSAAYISATPQAASEATIPSFWVAQRLGGKFKTLILAQLLVIPIGALLTPISFEILQKTYGVGLNPGQLTAPTGLKIATLAIAMEQGLRYLPRGALTASVIAIFIGVALELLLSIRKKNAQGEEVSRFWFVPVPSAVGIALILPPSLNIAMALGSVVSAIWRRLSTTKDGSYELFAAPLASGLIAGEAMVGSILLPVIMMLLNWARDY